MSVIKKAGCVVFLNKNFDRILNIKVRFNGKEFWTLPKGHIEKQEDPITAALRETEEETGVKVKILNTKPLITNFSNSQIYWFPAIYQSGELTPQIEENIIIVRWLSLFDSLKKNIFYFVIASIIRHRL